ncbi:AraC family transcriptional regulator [Nocardia huaxiensis]|uniref:AraC family transcriptional regulator n=1 Tax=Nocardia huaxiensis TaxID=2755382 RepID=A0A7D6VCS2_9NOCA|nr:AraC family transcriptional regulator [Nocardia huaxiensis]QLY31893.1 AraC family transcriptional regulator [Nocardia huaxiensis]UFS95460.1 AraC family transcriptional regulator [Nocardia huaxiensis]
MAEVEVCSSSNLSARQAFEQWEAAVADAVVPARIEPLCSGHWHGKVSVTQFDRFSVSRMRASSQRVVRTKRMVEQSSDEFLLVNMVLDGTNWTEQGQTATTRCGSIAFFDSGLPLESRTTENSVSAIVRAPLRLVLEHSGLNRNELPTATAIPIDGALGVVAGFFKGLSELSPGEADRAATVLGSEGASMLASALLLATGKSSPAPSDSLYTRQQVFAFMRAHCTDPNLTIEDIAHACLISRRTLYRACEGHGGPGGLLRRMRVEVARKLLRADPARPLAAIAAASGFATDRHFYRAFREETGFTPGQFRGH